MSLKVMNRVWQESKAKGSALLLMLAIADNCNDERGYAWPSVKTLAAKSRMSARQAQRVVKELAAKGELLIVEGGGRSNTHRYYVLVGMPDAEADALRDASGKGDILTPFESENTSRSGENQGMPKRIEKPKIHPAAGKNAPVNPGDFFDPEPPEGLRIAQVRHGKRVTSCQGLEGVKGDISALKGDISAGKGDTQARKGDIAMSPELKEPLLKEPLQEHVDAWRRLKKYLFQTGTLSDKQFYQRTLKDAELVEVEGKCFMVALPGNEIAPGVSLADYMNDRANGISRHFQGEVRNWDAKVMFCERYAETL